MRDISPILHVFRTVKDSVDTDTEHIQFVCSFMFCNELECDCYQKKMYYSISMSQRSPTVIPMDNVTNSDDNVGFFL
jgi:hypothetical protein